MIAAISIGVSVLGFILLVADLTQILRKTWPYRMVCSLMMAAGIALYFLVPDPRADWIKPTLAVELNALCALEQERAAAEYVIDPDTSRPMVTDNQLLQAVREACQSR